MRRWMMLVVVVLVAAGLAPAPAGAGGLCHDETAAGLTEGRGYKDVTVPIEGCVFAPTVLYVGPGTEVTWINRDPMGHTVTGAALSWGDHDNLAPDGTVTHTFKKEGVFPYYCLLHPSMVGAVVVGGATGRSAAAPIMTDVDTVLEDRPEAHADEAAAADTVPARAGRPADGLPWAKAAVLVALSLVLGWALAAGSVLRRRFARGG